jgi:uncharacterized RDD family membrane protein YckC
MAETASCPKCGFERLPGATECPACGVIYARYDPERAAHRRLAAAGDLYDPTRPAAAVDPYRAPMAAVTDVRPFASATELARRFTRLAAQILDGLIYGGAVLVGMLPLIFFGAGATPPNEDALMALFLGLMLLAAGAVFVVNLYFLHRDGQTLGKKALKIRIVRTNDERASLGRIFALRMLVPGVIGAVPIVGSFFPLVDALFIFGEQRRCIHDYLADTKVVVV